MENGSRLRIALFSLLGVILLVFSIWAVVAITRNIFKPAKTPQSTAQKAPLTDYARGGTAVKLQVGGAIVGDDTYVSYQIEVNENYRTLTTYSGYQQTLTGNTQYANNSVAYATFMRALERQGFLIRLRNSTDTDEGVAACSSSKRFAYILTDQGDQVSRLWNTACSGKQGTAGGSTTTVQSLFKAQITDYSKIMVGPYAILR